MSQNPLSLESAELVHVTGTYTALVGFPGTTPNFEVDAPGILDRLRGNAPELPIDLEHALRHTRGRFRVLGGLIHEAETNPALNRRLADVYKIADDSLYHRLEAEAREAMALADQQNQPGGWSRWVPERWSSTVRHWDGLRREAGLGRSLIPTRNLEQRRLSRRVAEMIEQRFAHHQRFNQLDPNDQRLVQEEVGRLAPNFFAFGYGQLHQWANVTPSNIPNPDAPAGGPANFTYYQLVERMLGPDAAHSRPALTILSRLQKGDATNQYRLDFEAEYTRRFNQDRQEKEQEFTEVQGYYNTEVARRSAQEDELRRQKVTLENSEAAPLLLAQILERATEYTLSRARVRQSTPTTGQQPNATAARIIDDSGKAADRAEAGIRALYSDYQRKFGHEIGIHLLLHLSAGTPLPQTISLPEALTLGGLLIIPPGQSIVLPDSLTLAADSQIPVGEIIRMPTALTLQQPITWPAGAAPLNIPGRPALFPGAVIPVGTILPQGILLPESTILPQGMTLPRGTQLPQGFSIPAGSSLPQGTRIPEGSLIPAGTPLTFSDTFFQQLPPINDLLHDPVAPGAPTGPYEQARVNIEGISGRIQGRAAVLHQLYDTSKTNWDTSKDASYSTTNCPHLYNEGYEDFADLQNKHRTAGTAVKTARAAEPHRDTGNRFTPQQLLYRLMDRELGRQNLPFEERQTRAVVGTLLLMDMVDTDVDEGWAVRQAKRITRSRVGEFFRRKDRLHFDDFVKETLVRQEKFKELKSLTLETTADQILTLIIKKKMEMENLPELMHHIELLSQDQLEGEGKLAFGVDVRPLLNQVKLAWYRLKATEILQKTSDPTIVDRPSAILALMKADAPKMIVPPPRPEHRHLELLNRNRARLRDYKEEHQKVREEAKEGSKERAKEDRILSLLDRFGSITLASAGYILMDEIPDWIRRWRTRRKGGKKQAPEKGPMGKGKPPSESASTPEPQSNTDNAPPKAAAA